MCDNVEHSLAASAAQSRNRDPRSELTVSSADEGSIRGLPGEALESAPTFSPPLRSGRRSIARWLEALGRAGLSTAIILLIHDFLTAG